MTFNIMIFMSLHLLAMFIRVCASMCEFCIIVGMRRCILDVFTQNLSVTDQVHKMPMSFSESLGQRSRLGSDSDGNLVNLIAPESLKGIEPRLKQLVSVTAVRTEWSSQAERRQDEVNTSHLF